MLVEIIIVVCSVMEEYDFFGHGLMYYVLSSLFQHLRF